MSVPSRPINGLLSALKPKTYKRLQPKLELVVLTYADVLYEVGSEIKTVFFPENGMVSLLSAVGDGLTLEVGIVGSEGMVGLSLFLGDKVSHTQALVQGTGVALAMKASDLAAECRRDDELPALLRGFTRSLFVQVSQSAVCNRYHTTEERMAKWLLMTRDRMRSDRFRITQDFLSNMVGVRREAVSKAAGIVASAGIISYIRGDLTILDGAALEKAACSCYAIIAG